MTIHKPWPEHKNPRPQQVASAPYNFVPLPEVIVSAVGSPDELPDHDEFDAARLSGYFDVTLTTRSPLYIRGSQTMSDFEQQQRSRASGGHGGENKPKDVPEFFYMRDRHDPVLPGSSLRGMLRGLLEIVSYSKVQPVSRKQLFFRTMDNTAVGDRYRERMIGLVETGFLVRQKHTYVIRTCSMARVDRSMIQGSLYDGKAPNQTPHWQGRSQKTGQYAPVWVKIGKSAQTGKGGACRPDVVEEICFQQCAGMREGRLVITGDIPRSGRNPGKQQEFVFLLPADGEAIDVPNEVIDRFHDNDQITQWQEKAFPVNQPKSNYRRQPGMLGEKPAEPGDPIFFLRERGTLTFIGRAQSFRLPYTRSPSDLVNRRLRDSRQIDYAEALFGFVRTHEQLEEMEPNPPEQGTKGRSYAGRVIVTDAHLQPGQTAIWLAGDSEQVLRSKILASPKPTAFQQYLTQQRPDAKDKLDHYDSRSADGTSTTTIRGHKLYWHQGLDPQELRPEQIRDRISDGYDRGEEASADTQRTRFKPLRPGVTFSFRVSFENLSACELGALCWTLHPDGEPGRQYCHHLGMGKPLGMGAVELRARLHLIDRQQRYRTLFDGNAWQVGIPVAPSGTSLPASNGEDLAFPDVLACRTKPFEDHILQELHPFPSCKRLRNMRRIAVLLKLLEWPGYRSVENGEIYLATENPPRPNTRYMRIRPNEYCDRFVLPDPTFFDPSSFENTSDPQVPGVHAGSESLIRDQETQRVEQLKRELERLQNREVAGSIGKYYQRWQQLECTDTCEELARAIVATVRRLRCEASMLKKDWYQKLLASLPDECAPSD